MFSRKTICQTVLFSLISVPVFAREPQSANLNVEGANDDYTESGIVVQKGDWIMVVGAGSVTTGSFVGSTGTPLGHGGQCRAGSDTDGALIMKIGATAPVRAGDQLLLHADKDGPLKFKVRDTKYSDNSGSYAVSVIVWPADATPTFKQVEVEAGNDEWTPTGLEVGSEGFVLVQASGKASVLGKDRDPDGVKCAGERPADYDDDGALMMKVGTTTTLRCGVSSILLAPAAGPIKFRVRSGGKYEGNRGKYLVNVAVLKDGAADAPATIEEVAAKADEIVPAKPDFTESGQKEKAPVPPAARLDATAK